MANWKPRTVKDVVQEIESGHYVLPVIQRQLVWKEEKMGLLFDSLLKGNSFGGIMVLQEDKDYAPLFAYRRFSQYGEDQMSVQHPKVTQTTYLVIDGQQRLQSFFMGIKGGKDGKVLFFNLLSSAVDYEFSFAASPAKLPQSGSNELDETLPKLWYPVRDLFKVLKDAGGNPYSVSNKILQEHEITTNKLSDLVQKNVLQFYMAVFAGDHVGISSVTIDRSSPEKLEEEKQRIVELFRRLNDGGTRLSTLDLVASMLKGFDYRMEKFLKEVEQFEDIGVSQDEVVKLIFILQDNHNREITQITKKDTEFAIENRERIVESLNGTRQFLKFAKLYDYYSSGTRSDVPLYFIAYHLFHKDLATSGLIHAYDNYDANNPDFLLIKRWLYLSILNGVFSRGSGWIPYRTGIRKILQVMKLKKNKLFPTHAIFRAYANHPLRFRETLSPERLNSWDREFVFYLIYDHQTTASRDVDHIHPISLLEASNDPVYKPSKIHSIGNYQLLDIGTNRNEKRAQKLSDWINTGIADKTSYLKRHLIPTDPTLWEKENFADFLESRSQKIADKIQTFIPEPITITDESEAEDQGKPAHQFDFAEHQDEIPPDFQDHSILMDDMPWDAVYRKNGIQPIWASRYRNELQRSAGITTVSDMAGAIMLMKLEIWEETDYGDGAIYRFHKKPIDGKPLELTISNFGTWAWTITLHELKERGFNWEEFLIG